eukprot:scaffold18271_cov29-Tisochrysis_lutea.AAC.1
MNKGKHLFSGSTKNACAAGSFFFERGPRPKSWLARAAVAGVPPVLGGKYAGGREGGKYRRVGGRGRYRREGGKYWREGGGGTE